MDKILEKLQYSCFTSNNWIRDNVEQLEKTQKSRIEYYQMLLFDKAQDVTTLINDIKENYQGLLYQDSEKIYYKKIEKLAYDYLMGEDSLNEISTIFEVGFTASLFRGEIPLDILANRNYLYILTHDVFYSSIFGRTTKVFKELLECEEYVIRVFETALLITIRHSDVDVLAELICCLFILGINHKVDAYIWELVLKSLQEFQLSTGEIALTKGTHAEITFEQVYHTTLVMGILGYLMRNRYDR